MLRLLPNERRVTNMLLLGIRTVSRRQAPCLHQLKDEAGKQDPWLCLETAMGEKGNSEEKKCMVALKFS